MNSLRVGLSGSTAAGRAAALHVRLHDDCDIVIVHDEDARAAHAFAAEAGIGRSTGDFDELLGSGVDFVLLTGPLPRRLQQVQAAAEQGAHVLVQAPMAPDLATAQAMQRSCDAAGVRLGVAVPWLGDPVIEQLRRMLSADWLGGLTCVQAISGNDAMLHAPSTAPRLHPFLDAGAPLLHLTSWMTGRAVTQVTAQASRLFSPEVDDSGVATLALRGNVLATLIASHLTAVQSFAVHGTDGGVRIAGDRIWLRGRSTFQGEVFDYPRAGEELVLARADLLNPLARGAIRTELLGRFARWIDDRDDYPCPGEQAVADMQVLAALMRAVQSGRAEQP